MKYKLFRFVLALFLVVFVFACNKAKYFIIKIPHDYQGNIFIVFGIKNSAELTRKKEFLYTTISNPPILLTSYEYNKDLSSLNLVIQDKSTNTNIDLGSPSEKLSRVLFNKIDTLTVNGYSYTYFTAFISKNYTTENDYNLIPKLIFYKYQFNELKNELSELNPTKSLHPHF
ncbi:MAG TPA: hypothetical protein VHB70_18425 [Parafilimonas sp.]|nr:hypothetical protein [Parafilimonas sp.]